MIRTITGFHADSEGDWVAELSCYHAQHVRHQPPFREREWVLEATGRAGHIGSPIECPLCDRAELPENLAIVSRAGPWDQETLPEALRRAHQTPGGRWGRLLVHDGSAGFQFDPEQVPPGPVIGLVTPSIQPIPPQRPHRVLVTGDVQLELELWGPVGTTPETSQDRST